MLGRQAEKLTVECARVFGSKRSKGSLVAHEDPPYDDDPPRLTQPEKRLAADQAAD